MTVKNEIKKRIIIACLTLVLFTGWAAPTAVAMNESASFSGAAIALSHTRYVGYDGVIKDLEDGWYFVGEFNDGIAVVIRETDFWSYQNGESGSRIFGAVNAEGELAFQLECEKLNEFSKGAAAIKIEGKWGIVDSYGELLFEPSLLFDDVGVFRDELASVYDASNEKYGFINREGRLIIPCIYEESELSDCSEGLIALRDNSRGICSYWDASTGEKAFDREFSSAYPFSEGVATVFEWGVGAIIDKSGNTIFTCPNNISLVPSSYEPCSEGLILGIIWQDGERRHCYLDQKGNVVLTLPYGMLAGAFHDGLAKFVLTHDILYPSSYSKWGFIDKTGKVVLEFPKTADVYCGHFSEGYLFYETVDHEGMISGRELVANPLGASAGLPFFDVGSHWARENIFWAYESGYITGISTTVFKPEALMTRAMLVTILHRLAGEPKSTGEIWFSDVPLDKWYTNAVCWAAENEIVFGYGDDTFGTDDNVSRQDLAVMLLRYAAWAGSELPETGESTTFADKNLTSAYAKSAVDTLARAGIIKGRLNGIFDPLGMSTRAEAAAILSRFSVSISIQ